MNTQLKNEQQQLKQLQAGKKHLELFEKHCLQRDRLAAEQNEELPTLGTKPKRRGR